MIKRKHIRHFLAIADAGSFAQAAARLHITQPSLSTGIAELEQLTGSRLFERARRHVRLTEAGGAFLPIARELELGFRKADGFGSGANTDWPTLRLGVLRSVANPMLSAITGQMLGHYGVELVEGNDYDLRAGLAAGRLHLALTTLRETESALRALPLWREPYRMIVPNGHPLADSEMVAADDLASEIMIARRNCELLEETSRFFTRSGVRPRFALRSESDERCLEMVVAGLGITTAPMSMVRRGTVAINIAGYVFNRQIGLLGHPSWQEEFNRKEVPRAIRAALARLDLKGVELSPISP